MRTLFVAAYAAGGVWCFGALAYLPLESRTAAFFTAGLFAVFALGFLAFRPHRYLIPAGLFLMVVTTVIFSQLKPDSNREWAQKHSETPYAEFTGDVARKKITFHNMRDFRYRAEDDYTYDFVNQNFSCDALTGLDFIFARAPGSEKIIHTMLSFAFSDGRHIVFSLEARRTRFDAKEDIFIPGMYKEYESILVAGTEEDLLCFDALIKGYDVYLFRSSLTGEKTLALFLDITEMMNNMKYTPVFYNSVTYPRERSFAPSLERTCGLPPVTRLLALDGLSDAEAFNAGLLAKKSASETFDELKRRSYINSRLASTRYPYTNFSISARSEK